MKAFVIDVPMYNTGVVVFVEATRDEALKWLKKQGLYAEDKFDEEMMDLMFRDPMSYTGTALSKQDGRRHAVHIREFGHGIVAHEMLHVVFSMLEYIGMWYAASSEEAYTYLLEHLIREFYVNYYK